MRNGNFLTMRASEIRVKRIRVNQGLGVYFWRNCRRVRKYHSSITNSYSLGISWEFPIPCFTPWSFPITLSFPVYLPLALRCYQVYFWRNCRRLLPKSGKISQEHHWQQECQEQFELSYATGRQSFPIDSSPLLRSAKQKKSSGWVKIFPNWNSNLYI